MKINDHKKNSIIKNFQDAFTKSKTLKKDYMRMYEDGYDYFMGKEHPDVEQVSSADRDGDDLPVVQIPVIKKQILTISDRYTNFDISANVSLKGPRGSSDNGSRDVAEGITEFLADQNDASTKIENALKLMGIYGSAYIGVLFRYEKEKMSVLEPITDTKNGLPLFYQGSIKKQLVIKEVETHLCCDYVVIPPWEMFVSPDAHTQLYEKEYIIWRHTARVDDLKNNKMYRQFGEVEKLQEQNIRDEADVKKYADDLLSKTYAGDLTGVCYVHHWFQKKDNMLTIIGGDDAILYHGPNIYATNDKKRRYPFTVIKDDGDPIQYEGTPKWRNTEHNQRAMERLMSEMLGLIAYKFKPMFMKQGTTTIQSDAIVMKRGGVVNLDGAAEDIEKSFKPISLGSIDPAGFNLYQMLAALNDEFGTPKSMSGMPTGADTATDVLESSAGRQITVDAIDERIRRDLIKPMVLMGLDRWNQNGSEEKTMEIIESRGIPYLEQAQTEEEYQMMESNGVVPLADLLNVSDMTWGTSFDMSDKDQDNTDRMNAMELYKVLSQDALTRQDSQIDANKAMDYLIRNGFDQDPDEFKKSMEDMSKDAMIEKLTGMLEEAYAEGGGEPNGNQPTGPVVN